MVAFDDFWFIDFTESFTEHFTPRCLLQKPKNVTKMSTYFLVKGKDWCQIVHINENSGTNKSTQMLQLK